MKTRLLGVAALLVLMAGCINVSPMFTGRLETVLVEKSPRWFEVNRIALIDVDGFIGAGDGLSLIWGGTTAADVKEKLRRAAKDGSVKAIVLRVNSPGGTVTGSDVIYQELLKFKKDTGKPVVAACMDMATSGGLYASLAADRIVASPTTVTGSVGVIMEFMNAQGLLAKIGLQSEVIKSGALKDIGSAMRPMTPEERELLQAVNRAMFERFVQTVRTGRPQMTAEDIKAISDGRILTAQQAQDLHVVDRIGYLDDAIAEAKTMANIGGADVILYRPFPSYNSNIYANRSPGTGVLEEGIQLLLRRSSPAFLYLWQPGE